MQPGSDCIRFPRLGKHSSLEGKHTGSSSVLGANDLLKKKTDRDPALI